jgi:XTP/dITP diphosphohydrolase
MAHRKLNPGKLVIASHNAGKVREIRALLEPYGIDPVSAGDLGLPEPEETGTSFAKNALLKALASAAASGLPALADDSGLCVDALGGRPGVYTADWAERQAFEGPPGRDWYLAMGKVEGLLAEQGLDVDRSARFVCTLALAWPDGHAEVFEGRAEGSLTWPPRGTLGFGYDPVFVPTGNSLTYAEIDPAEKHAISHRADAFAKLVAGVL